MRSNRFLPQRVSMGLCLLAVLIKVWLIGLLGSLQVLALTSWPYFKGVGPNGSLTTDLCEPRILWRQRCYI